MGAKPVFTLYYAPDNASLIVRLALEEAGLPYSTALVDRAVDAQKSPDYLAVNPVGVIPTLITPKGPISETAACLLWLGDAYPEAGLAPTIQNSYRLHFLRWLFFLSNTVHADLIRIFYPSRFVPPESVAFHHERISKRVVEHLKILETIARQETPLFQPPSALILYLGPLLRWAALYPVSGQKWLDLDAFPTLKKLVLELENRASVQSATAAEGLGKSPFSNPQLPNPPESTSI